MILKKVIENDKEIYVPISFEEAVKIHDKTQLVFSSEDEEDEFEEKQKTGMCRFGTDHGGQLQPVCFRCNRALE